MKNILLVCVLSLFASCATEFYGEAHITPKQCEAKCTSWNMEMDAMVAMGEYSDACVCRKKESMNKAATSGATGAGAIGTILQMRAQQQQANASHARPGTF